MNVAFALRPPGGFPFRRLALLALALAAGLAAPAAPSGSVPKPTDQPHVFLDAADFARINALARAEPWAGKIRADLVQAAEEWPASQVRTYGLKEWAPPPEGGGWAGDYVCPDDGAHLEFSPGHNRCPRCGKDYHGWPFDYVIYLRRHMENARAVRDLGLAFRLTGRPEFAAKARAILAAYARLYPTLPIRDHKIWPKPDGKSGGRVTAQTLNESDWVRDMAFGYDLVRETVPAAERLLVERDILRNASAVVARRERSLGNWTARHNAAHLAVGLVLGDQALVDLALNAEYGFRDELRRSVTADGEWNEGSWGYHFYVLEPLLAMREMAARAGLAVPEAARLEKMLDAPLACSLPDGTLPNFNDSGFTSLTEYAEDFDIGFRLYGDRRYLPIVRGGSRGLRALLWGAAAVGEGETPRLASSILPDAGFATLRTAGNDFTIAVKFGPYLGGHSHFDRLNFVSFAAGRNQAVDPGSQSYGFKTHHTWDRVTLAHNTLVVDERSQGESTGKLLEWHATPGVTAIRLEDTTSYPQVRLERLLVQTERYAIDVYSAEAKDGKPHRFDWIYHNAGRAETALALAPYRDFPAHDGYQHLSATRAVATAGDWTVDFVQPGSRMRLHLLGQDGTTAVVGDGLGEDLTVPVPFAMARRQGAATRFIAVLEPFADATNVRRAWLESPDVVAVETADGLDEINLAAGHFAWSRKK